MRSTTRTGGRPCGSSPSWHSRNNLCAGMHVTVPSALRRERGLCTQQAECPRQAVQDAIEKPVLNVMEPK